ncbi:hypothetical protein U1Q18_008139 [Sarracenia purpurea var. burkii]
MESDHSSMFLRNPPKWVGNYSNEGGRGFKAESEEGGWIGEEKSVGEGLRWLATESGEVAEVNGGLCGGGSETGAVKIEG